jgi:hypothetical protein
MSEHQDDFRGLFETLAWHYEGENAYKDILLTWEDRVKSRLEWIRPYGEISARQRTLFQGKTQHSDNLDEDVLYVLWELYALSRVNDELLLSFQPVREKTEGWKQNFNPTISLGEYGAFMSALGMSLTEKEVFHPFYHEIVRVEQSDNPLEPITILDTLWPCYMLGSMMFSRAGVTVQAGQHHIVKEIAENSTMYFTYRRRNRPTYDLSMGWGSNSQWRTDFRRDYEDEKAYYYNVDMTGEISPRYKERDDLMPDEQLELLRHRCFIKTPKDVRERSPHYYTYTEMKKSGDSGQETK